MGKPKDYYGKVKVIGRKNSKGSFKENPFKESLKENLENPIRGAPGVPDPDACPDGEILGKHFKNFRIFIIKNFFKCDLVNERVQFLFGDNFSGSAAER